MIEDNADLPFDSLHLMIGDISYGGRVGIESDLTILKILLKEFLNENIYKDENYNNIVFPKYYDS